MFYYICYRGRVWNPRQTCVLFASIYGCYAQGDHTTPFGSEDFDGVTIIKQVTRDFAVQAVERGAKIFSNMPDTAIKAALGID